MKKFWTSVGLIVLLFSIWAQAGSEACGSFYRIVKPVLSYGLEIEFTPSINLRLLSDYRPTGTSEKKWSKFTTAEKLEFLSKHSTRTPIDSLVRMARAPEWLPAEIEREPHGTYEATGMVFQSLDALNARIQQMENRYGRGSAQVHVVFDRRQVKQPLSGFVSFSADRAQLRNLVLGYQKYLKDEDKLPAANIGHYVLGPLNAGGEKATLALEKQIVAGKKLTNETGGKYFLATVLRAGIYGHTDRIGFEFRQFNFDYPSLKEEVAYVSQLITEGKLGKFKRFEDTIQAEYEINARVTEEHGRNALDWVEKLERIEPAKSNLALNMMFFLRDWKNHPIIETMKAGDKVRMRTRLMELETQLLADLNQLMAQNLRTRETVIKIRVLVAKWAHESGLLEAFDAYERSVLIRSPINESIRSLDAG